MYNRKLKLSLRALKFNRQYFMLYIVRRLVYHKSIIVHLVEVRVDQLGCYSLLARCCDYDWHLAARNEFAQLEVKVIFVWKDDVCVFEKKYLCCDYLTLDLLYIFKQVLKPFVYRLVLSPFDDATLEIPKSSPCKSTLDLLYV